MGKKREWFMDISDKTTISETRCCPPHYFPHKMPFGERICDERCHVHQARWRMAHHISFCRVLRCPHYRFMIESREKTSQA